MATITGIAGSSVTATCTVSDDGQLITQAESAATAQAIENDIATLAALKLDLSKALITPTILSATATIVPVAGKPLALYTVNPALVNPATFTLQTTTAPTPTVGQRVRFFVPCSAGPGALAHTLSFQREGSGGALLCALLGGAQTLSTIEFAFTQAYGWVISDASAADTEFDPGTDTHIYGY